MGSAGSWSTLVDEVLMQVFPPPFYMFQDNDTIVFERQDDIELFLEPVDVDDDLDTLYFCADGRRLKPTLKGGRVRLVESEQGADPEELRRQIVEFLLMVGEDMDERMKLDDAIRISRKYAHRVPRTFLEILFGKKR